jgi:hypothetical protein
MFFFLLYIFNYTNEYLKVPMPTSGELGAAGKGDGTGVKRGLGT